MKKSGILNHELSDLIARLGHTDTITIADAGLPVPPGVQRIDLALTGGMPALLDVLRLVLDDLAVEKVVIAAEMKDVSPAFYKELGEVLGQIEVEQIPHAEFKQLTQASRAVIRTGEFTYFSNVLIVAGVAF